KQRNDAFNRQLRELETQLATIQTEEQRQKDSTMDMERIRQALDRELSFQNGINSNLVAAILEKIVVKKESTKHEIHLDIFLKLGARFDAVYDPRNLPASINRLKSTTPRPPIRRT
ncbi:MAG: recombinase family protein, partial [Faecousia sp.]